MKLDTLNWQSILFIKTIGLIFGLFLSKKFVNTFKDETRSTDESMYLLYRYAAITNRVRFILFWLIGPTIFILIIYLIN
ncbi:hypothetical protein [Staphylococcus gallinarum]|uniref:hypothetical protein n=1 Tax=Staphylococcus gallinarum TaxID=1293 RepID=UPI001E40E70C|nr:hypothetical protein [Staphylococcus gallinarum]MCD8845152.1 hypothetical protein [Staphylococcus gallinarum]